MIPYVAVVILALFCWFGKIGFGTFVVDPALLYILGYFITYFIYRYLTPVLRFSAARRFFTLLFPFTLLSLWAGGIAPYFGLMNSQDVYLGLLPQSIIGPVNGNDFMWNGLGTQLIFGRIVPESLIPTYQYFLFNVLGILVWISFPFILGAGVLRGQAAALCRDRSLLRILVEWLKIILTGLLLSLLVAAFAALVSVYYLK